MSPEIDSTIRQLKSNYLDKLFTTYTDASKRIALQITFTTVLSIMLVLVSVGYLTVSQGWTIAGLTFNVPLPALLVGGALFLMWRHLLIVGVGLQQGMAARAIWRIYCELGLEDPTLTEDLDMFDRPDGIGLFVPLHSFHGSYGTQIIFLIDMGVQLCAGWLLPMAVQVLVARKLVIMFGTHWWLISAYALFSLLLGLYYAQIFRLWVGEGTKERSLAAPMSGSASSSSGAERLVS
jgi:hypothetical protein